MRTRTIDHLKDDIYQLIEVDDEPYERTVIYQGTLAEINAWLELEKKGFTV